jgi:hypothetical protein
VTEAGNRAALDLLANVYAAQRDMRPGLSNA